MPLPDPFPGLVIRYSYLWFSEHAAGYEEGSKDRPCAIVAAIRANDEGDIRILVLPVTHRRPIDSHQAVEIPAAVKNQLRLDAERSWIVVSEWNEFLWPGPDLRRAPGGGDASAACGVIPSRMFNDVRRKFLALVGTSEAKRVRRNE